jgi:hypothetical protein
MPSRNDSALPRPACGVRVGVRGRLRELELGETSPHPTGFAALRRFTSPRKRGEVKTGVRYDLRQIGAKDSK